MKLNKKIALIAGLIAIIGTGCVNLNSGNVASHVKPPPYRTNELAVVSLEKKHIAPNGETTTDITTETKTGLAVAEGVEQGLIGVAKEAVKKTPIILDANGRPIPVDANGNPIPVQLDAYGRPILQLGIGGTQLSSMPYRYVLQP